jgi:hypothetical protein
MVCSLTRGHAALVQQLQARQITEEERALAAHYLPAAAIPTEGALGGVAPAAQEGWVKVWGRKLGMSEAKLGSVDRHVTKVTNATPVAVPCSALQIV